MRSLLLISLILGAVASAGCAAKPKARSAESAAFLASVDPRQLDMFDGRSAARIDWAELMRRVHAADVIVIGEQHDDAVGHRVQLAIVEDAFAAEDDPARRASIALSVEMLERDEQALADDFLEGIIDADSLETLSHSKNWGGEGKWKEFYLPIFEAARDGGGRIVAANAPRRYVRLARTDGYDRLDQLPRARRRLFDLPEQVDDEAYWQRFVEVMSDPHDEHGTAAATQPQASTQPHNEPGNHALRPGFRSQRLWDSTMAGSIARAHRRGASRIIHLVGQFHSDFEGATVLEIRARLPGANVFVISMQSLDRAELPMSALREDDRDRADVIIYTVRDPYAANGSSSDA